MLLCSDWIGFRVPLVDSSLILQLLVWLGDVALSCVELGTVLKAQ